MSPNDEMTRDRVREWMKENYQDFIDPGTDDLNLTQLAEGAAWEANHNEWLDDPHHWVFVDAYNTEVWYLRNQGIPDEWQTGHYIDQDSEDEGFEEEGDEDEETDDPE